MNNTTANIAPITVSANGIEVFSHPAGHPHRSDLLAETISKITLKEGETFHRETINLGRVIGKDHLVETCNEDYIVYLRRGNRPGETRMVLKEAADTSYVTIILCVARKDEETPDELVGKWVVVTLFEGQPGEREPWDNSFIDKDINNNIMNAYLKAEAFWATHALVPTEEEMKQIRKVENAIFVIPADAKYGVWRAQKEGEYSSLEEAEAAAKIIAWEDGDVVTICVCFPGFGVPVKRVW